MKISLLYAKITNIPLFLGKSQKNNIRIEKQQKGLFFWKVSKWYVNTKNHQSLHTSIFTYNKYTYTNTINTEQSTLFVFEMPLLTTMFWRWQYCFIIQIAQKFNQLHKINILRMRSFSNQYHHNKVVYNVSIPCFCWKWRPCHNNIMFLLEYNAVFQKLALFQKLTEYLKYEWLVFFFLDITFWKIH